MNTASVFYTQCLRYLRIQREQTQRHVAEHLGIHIKTYAAKERGFSELTLTELNKLARYWKVTPSAILRPPPPGVTYKTRTYKNRRRKETSV